MHPMSFSLAELARITGAKLVGDPEHRITDVEDLELAQSTDASFLANPRYEQLMQKSQAGVIFVAPYIKLPPSRNFLITDSPSRAFQTTIEAFHEQKADSSAFSGVHPTAVVHPSSEIGNCVSIGPLTVVDQRSSIGSGTHIGAGCSIGPYVRIGKDCRIYANVTIREHCVIGDRTVLQPGAVIGSCGFGFVPDCAGKHIKLKQLGTVIIEDDVEIGANTTVDRARFKKTIIKKGTKIDNLVQIGHGVVVGEDCIIVAQVGIAGSTKIGKRVMIGGQAAAAGHLSISDEVMIAAKSGVSKSLKSPGKYGGTPAIPLAEHNRLSVHLRKIDEYAKKIKQLERKIAELESVQNEPGSV